MPTTSTSAAASTSAAPRDDDVAIAALLDSADVGGGFLAGSGETFLGFYDLGAALPECAAFVDSVFHPLASATTRTRTFFKQFGAQFEQMVLVFPTADAATTLMDGVADPMYPACDVAVSTAAVNASPCCEQAGFVSIAPPALKSVGDQQVITAVNGTYVAGGTTATAAT